MVFNGVIYCNVVLSCRLLVCRSDWRAFPCIGVQWRDDKRAVMNRRDTMDAETQPERKLYRRQRRERRDDHGIYRRAQRAQRIITWRPLRSSFFRRALACIAVQWRYDVSSVVSR